MKSVRWKHCLKHSSNSNHLLIWPEGRDCHAVTFIWDILRAELNQWCKLAWNHWQCANNFTYISACVICDLVVLSIFICTNILFLLWIWAPQKSAMTVCFLPVGNQYSKTNRLAHDVFDAFATHTSLVYDVTAICIFFIFLLLIEPIMFLWSPFNLQNWCLCVDWVLMEEEHGRTIFNFFMNVIFHNFPSFLLLSACICNSFFTATIFLSFMMFRVLFRHLFGVPFLSSERD